MNRLLLFVITAALLPASASAKSDSQLWTGGTVNVKLNDHWRLSEEVVARFSDNRKGLYEVESNTLLGYRLSKVTTLWAGYTHDPQYAGGDFKIMEQRAREQATFDNFAKIGPGKLTGRLRLEQRWRSGLDGTAWRVRPYLKYSIPLKGKTALNLSNETFVNLNRTAFQTAKSVDRMRNFISISTPLTKNLTGEAGYLNQYGFVRGGPDTVDHVASFSVSLSL